MSPRGPFAEPAEPGRCCVPAAVLWSAETWQVWCPRRRPDRTPQAGTPGTLLARDCPRTLPRSERCLGQWDSWDNVSGTGSLSPLSLGGAIAGLVQIPTGHRPLSGRSPRKRRQAQLAGTGPSTRQRWQRAAGLLVRGRLVGCRQEEGPRHDVGATGTDCRHDPIIGCQSAECSLRSSGGAAYHDLWQNIPQHAREPAGYRGLRDRRVGAMSGNEQRIRSSDRER
jgi:hypothetical protein